MPPNVLIIITHNTGRHIGPYGRGVATPALDRLAGEGVVFERAFCAAPHGALKRSASRLV